MLQYNTYYATSAGELEKLPRQKCKGWSEGKNFIYNSFLSKKNRKSPNEFALKVGIEKLNEIRLS